eukprot:m.276619 g.276619  ORF g.276619 m.276619 type:complete len:380 (-) comp16303_c0_seq1:65-1204(-)
MEKKAPDSSESGLGLVRSAFGNGPPPAFGSSVFGSPTDAGTGFGATTFGGASASEGASGSPSKPLFGSSLEGASKSPPNKPLSGNSFGQLSSPKADTSAKSSAATAATPGESKALTMDEWKDFCNHELKDMAGKFSVAQLLTLDSVPRHAPPRGNIALRIHHHATSGHGVLNERRFQDRVTVALAQKFVDAEIFCEPPSHVKADGTKGNGRMDIVVFRNNALLFIEVKYGLGRSLGATQQESINRFRMSDDEIRADLLSNLLESAFAERAPRLNIVSGASEDTYYTHYIHIKGRESSSSTKQIRETMTVAKRQLRYYMAAYEHKGFRAASSVTIPDKFKNISNLHGVTLGLFGGSLVFTSDEFLQPRKEEKDFVASTLA